jgi:tight adherence protein C
MTTLMLDDQTIFLACAVGAVSLAAYFVAQFFFAKDEGRLRERLANRQADGRPGADARGNARAKSLFQWVGTTAAKPFMPETREKVSEIRRKLSRAGIYTPAAVKLVTGMKVICLLVGLVGGYAAGAALDSLMLGLSFGGLIGYTVPTFWLGVQVRKQQQALEYGLPDALDLMVVCVEAGLPVDAAMQRVGLELALAHPRLAREFEVTHMETRVGLARAEALRNLGARTGSQPLQSLASMLIQAERFGTSIAGALRVHGESLRASRQFKAEELAAKASVKMSFPLVLFIFPATFIILAGPTIIGLMNSAFFKD